MLSTAVVLLAVGTGVVVIVVALAIVLVVLLVTLSMRGRQRRAAAQRAEVRDAVDVASERTARQRDRDITRGDQEDDARDH